MLKSLEIKNYKSLRSVRLDDIPNFAVLVGANASGKSNFADAMDFLSLVFRGGLPHAIRTKGGYENICFRRERRSKAAIEFSLKAEEIATPPRVRTKRTLIYSYQFAFQATTEKIRADYKVTSESLSISDEDGQLISYHRTPGKPTQLHLNPRGQEYFVLPAESALRQLFDSAPHSDAELIGATMRGYTPRDLDALLQGCRVYQISPHMARQTGIPEQSPELGRHGENLPAAIDFLRRTRPQAFDELLSHLQNTVPAMKRVETRYVETKQLGLFFEERGVGRTWFSQDVSDGTLQTLCMFLPLLDPRVRIAVIEEPENSVHPWILRHFIETCEATAAQKQVLITTHSPIAINRIPVEALFVVERIDGETRIVPVVKANPEARRVVAEQMLGLGDYWDSGGLGGIPSDVVEDD